MQELRDGLTDEIAGLFHAAIGKQVRAASKAVAAGDSVDEAFESKHTLRAVRETWKRTAPLFAGEIYNALLAGRKDFDAALMSDWQEAADEFIARYGAQKVTLIDETTRSFIQRELAAGLEAGLGPREIARQILATWTFIGANGEEYGMNRSVRIARTELIGASNYGNVIGAESTGLELNKVWLTARDNRVRDRHQHLDGQTVDMNGTFRNGLEYPGDPRGNDPAEVVNCRCDVYWEEK